MDNQSEFNQEKRDFILAEESTFHHVETTAATIEQTSEKEERKLLRKIDLRVLPFLCITYALSLIDRTNIAAAKVAGMEKDLDLTGNRYSVALLVLFIPYIMVEIPSNALIRHVGARVYLAFLVAAWGTVAMCFGFLTSYSQVIGLRVLLGLFEGGFNPGCIFVISCWYKRYEVQQRLSVWFVVGSVVSGFGGIISYGLTTMDGMQGLEGWRWIFIIPGAVTIALALPILYFVGDFPEKCRWLSSRELEVFHQRMSDDRGEEALQQGESPDSLVGGFVAASTDWTVYAMACLLMLPTAGSYSFAFFTPSILGSLGYNVALSQILTTPPYIFSAIVSIATGIVADRVQKRSPFIIGYSVLVIIGLVLVGWGNNTGARMTGLFLAITGNNCAIPSALALLSNNVRGIAKRQFAVAIQTIFGGLGGIIGSLLFRSQDHPTYRPGLYASFGCMALNIFITCVLAVYFWRKNKIADQQGRSGDGTPGFRYTI